MTRVVILGNFVVDYTTETHWARSFEALGCEVVRLQENRTTLAELEAHGQNADLTFWMRTWGALDPAGQTRAWRSIESNGGRTVTVSLDLYWGLPREAMIDPSAPAWSTGWVFTADGDPLAEEGFARLGIQHVWLPPACVADECVPGVRVPEFAAFPVAFVGSAADTYHPEWAWRRQLLDGIEARYGSLFRRWGAGAEVVRSHRLNDLYASVGVAVGDSLCPLVETQSGPRRKQRYWSDRVCETLGRAGVGVFPDVPGMAECYGLAHGEHCWFYEIGNLTGVFQAIDWCLAYPEEARALAVAGQQAILAGHTYVDRARTILETVGVAVAA